MKRIVLHIDQLVLRGVERTDAAAVAVGVQAELRRLLAEPGAAAPLAEGGHRVRIKAGAVHVAPSSGARGVGRAVARGIVRGAGS